MPDVIYLGSGMDISQTFPDLAAAIAHAAGQPATIVVSRPMPAGTLEEIPHTIALEFKRGGRLQIADDNVVIAGHVTAGLWQIFEYEKSGTVLFRSGSVLEVYPEWWGARTDLPLFENTASNKKDVEENRMAIRRAICSLPERDQVGEISGSRVRFAPGRYVIDGGIVVDRPVDIVGAGMGTDDGTAASKTSLVLFPGP